MSEDVPLREHLETRMDALERYLETRIDALAASSVASLQDRIGHFLDDWFGAPAREGVEERPGVMARLSAEEDATGELREAVTGLTEEVGRQPQHIDEMCEQMQRSIREERQEVVSAALTQHVSSFHAQPGAQQ